jgi:hypothetical protein
MIRAALDRLELWSLPNSRYDLPDLGVSMSKVSENRGNSMAGTTVTRAHLSQALHEEVGLSHNECAELLETVLREISGALIEGRSWAMSGSRRATQEFDPRDAPPSKFG